MAITRLGAGYRYHRTQIGAPEVWLLSGARFTAIFISVTPPDVNPGHLL